VKTAAELLARVESGVDLRRVDVEWERRLLRAALAEWWKARREGKPRRAPLDEQAAYADEEAMGRVVVPCRSHDSRVVHTAIALDMPASLVGLTWPGYGMLLRGEIPDVVPENLREMGFAGGIDVVCNDAPLHPSAGAHLAIVYEGLPRERASE